MKIATTVITFEYENGDAWDFLDSIEEFASEYKGPDTASDDIQIISVRKNAE